jgi:hypothetical protein
MRKTSGDFWKDVQIDQVEKCWVWTKGKNRHNYGCVRFNGNRYLTHRLAYLLHYKLSESDLEGACILHSCDNPPCCNPNHLKKGTNKENSEDMKSRRRHTYGERSALAKLSTGDVFQIRKLRTDGMFYRDIARLFNVNTTHVFNIVHRKRWAHI